MFGLIQLVLILLFIFAPSLVAGPNPASSTQVESPDGKVKIQISIKEKLDPYPQGKRVYYQVWFRGKEILLDSPFGLDFKDMPPLARDLVIISEKRQETRRGSREESLHVKLAPEGEFAFVLIPTK